MQFTQSEEILLFKQALTKLVTNSNLTIDILYYVLHDYIKDIDKLYDEYINTIIKNIKEIFEQEKQAQEES